MATPTQSPGPTPEEIALYESQVGKAPAPINPLKDLSAEDIATLAVEDKTFSIPDEFARQKDLHADPIAVQKVADAFNAVNQRGFKVKDLPSVKEAAGAVGTAIKGLAGQAWSYANVAGNVVAGAASELVGAEGLASGYAENITKRLGENVAGTEEAVTGLSQLGAKGLRKAGQAVGAAKEFSEYTPAERVTELFNKSGESEVREQRLTGKGTATKVVTGGEVTLDPEKVGELAAGDPLSFFAFGAGMGVAGKALKAVTPAVVKGAAGALARGAEGVASAAAPYVVGKGMTAAGVTAKGAARAVQATAPIVTPIYGAVQGAASFGPAGAIGGLTGGRVAGKAIARGAGRAAVTAESFADLGRQISGSIPIKSAYAQGARDILQALPGAVGEVAKGTALDIGLAAATAEVPQDVQGAVGFGTALGAISGGVRVARHTLSGQLIAPRAYGVSTPRPSSGQFPGFDAMHADAINAATPGVKARLNAMRQFAEGVAPGTDIFLGRDPASVERALIASGVSAETARTWSQAEGFFTRDLPGRNGTPRRVVIATNVDSVPHESQHVIQDVLGEDANQRIDAIVKETYADQWENEGNKYASRLTEAGDPRNWRDVVLDESGWGLSEAKEKIYRDINNELLAAGQQLAPRFLQELAQNELGRVMDAAVVRHPDANPNEIGRHVWRDVFEDSPADVVRISDKYIAREIAAENFDALFKNQGPRLEEGTQLPQRLARIIGGVVSAMGGEPLAGRTSEIGGVPLSTPVIEAVRADAKGLQPAVAPRGEARPPAAPAGPRPVRPPAGTPEAIQGAAEEARTIAAEAPDSPAPGGTRSPRELLGQIAEAIASQQGVKINYLSAPGEPAAATTSNRESRRAIIEAFRDMPPEARSLWEKSFFPDRVIRTKTGAHQIQGWAPEVFASNAHKVAKFLTETPGAESLSPYAVDTATKSFTPDAWQELYRDTQDFVQNQIRGATGSGEPLVVPRSVTEAGGFAPPTRAGAAPLAQNKADFINALFNFKLPETPRVQKGKLPLNLMGQEVSAATIPGRVEVPVRPRGEYTGEEAVRQGIEGRSIAEVNPFRNQLEAAAQAAGKPPPSLIEVIQKLNLENIKEVDIATELPEFRGNTLTLTAGLQPKAQFLARVEDAVKALPPVRSGFVRLYHGEGAAQGGGTGGSFYTSTAEKAATYGPKVSYVDLPEASARAARETARKSGSGGDTSILTRADVERSRQLAVEVEPTVHNLDAQFSPKELADQVEKFSPDDFRAWTESIQGGFTQKAWDVGLQSPDRAFVDSLKRRYEEIAPKAMAAIKAHDFDNASAIASQGQFFREAYEAATGTASAGMALRKKDPNFKPPFPLETAEPKAQLAGKKKEGEEKPVPVLPEIIPVQFALTETEAQAKKRIAETDYSQYAVKPKTVVSRKPKKTSGELLTAYHFSNSDSLTQTDPTRMRETVHGFWGKENPKTFFFLEGSEGEPGKQFKNRTAYTAKLAKNQLYDATVNDPLEYTTKVNREEADQGVIDAGYSGVIIPIKGGQKVVVMFDPVKVSPTGKTDGAGLFSAPGEPRGQLAAKKGEDKNLELGLNLPKRTSAATLVRREVEAEAAYAAANHPEALPLDVQRNVNGSIKIDEATNKPIFIKKEYELRDTPLARKAAEGIEAPAEQNDAIARAYADKIKVAYDEAAKNPAILAGKDWYSLTRTKLKNLFGADTKLFCEMLGATSANTPVDTNFRFAIDAYNKYKAGDYNAQVAKYQEGKKMWESGDITEARKLDTKNFLGPDPTRAKFREFWIDVHDLKPKQSNNKLFGFNSGALLRVLDGSWRAEVEGPKTPNFSDNLSGDGFEATIDVWAARLMRRLGYEGTAGQWRILQKNESGVSDADFFMAQKAFRLAGDELGVSPDSLQAIVWFLEKDVYEKSGWTKKAGAKKSDFNELLSVIKKAPAGKFSIDELQLKKNTPTPQGELQFQPAVVEARKGAAAATPFVPMAQSDAEKIADAIYKAEGGAKAKKPYGILSVKVANEAEARRVALNTIKNNWKRWSDAGRPGEYLEFLAGKYAPIGVANDPKALNKNWIKNVKALLDPAAKVK